MYEVFHFGWRYHKKHNMFEKYPTLNQRRKKYSERYIYTLHFILNTHKTSSQHSRYFFGRNWC